MAENLTVRDVRRVAARKLFDLVVAKNAALPDKASYTEAAGELVDAIVALAVQRALAQLRDMIAECAMNKSPLLNAPTLIALHANLCDTLLPEKPADEPTTTPDA